MFMGIVLICLILGLAIVIERIIYLNMATTNTNKLLKNVEDALNSGGIEAAKEVCRDTKGPVASIFYQGLDRSHEGVEEGRGGRHEIVTDTAEVRAILHSLGEDVAWITLARNMKDAKDLILNPLPN